MDSLLYLVHRIPYPPNKGDKIRSYNIFKYLSKKYHIYLGAFVDDENDWQYVEHLKPQCKDSFFIKLNPARNKLSSLSGLLTGEALSVIYYRNKHFKEWVNSTIRQNKIDKILAFSSPMAQYINEKEMKDRVKIMDLVDVDSDKWKQYSHVKKWPKNWIYKRESKKLFQYERKILSLFNKTTLVSEEEAGLLKSMAPELGGKISYFSNGVDTDYFSPDKKYRSPYKKEENIIVFSGAMDYWANVDAVKWFVEYVFPFVRDQTSDVKFYIVGSNPTSDVRALSKTPGVVVTGSVIDIRPYIYFSNIVVAPLRIARGIQNKILEAMALAKPVLASTAAAEGINVIPDKHLFIANTEHEYQRQIIKMLQGKMRRNINNEARNLVVDDYSWASKLEKLDFLLRGCDVA